MAQLNEKFLGRTWREWAGWLFGYLLIVITHRWVRVVLMLFFVLLLAWLSYTRGYKPLTEEVQLPISVQENNPNLNIKMLQAINTLRAERVRRERPDYSSYSRVLVAPEPNQ